MKTWCSANYTTQCRDETSGKTGCFLFDVEHWQETGKFKAISPVFSGLVEFYAWDHENEKKANEIVLVREG